MQIAYMERVYAVYIQKKCSTQAFAIAISDVYSMHRHVNA